MKLTLRKAHVITKQLNQWASNAASYVDIQTARFRVYKDVGGPKALTDGSEEAAREMDELMSNVESGNTMFHMLRGLVGKQNSSTTLTEGGPTVNDLLSIKEQAESTMRLYHRYSVLSNAPVVTSDDPALSEANGEFFNTVRPMNSVEVYLGNTVAGAKLWHNFNGRYMKAKRLQAEVVDMLAVMNNTITIELTDEQANELERIKHIAGIV